MWLEVDSDGRGIVTHQLPALLPTYCALRIISLNASAESDQFSPWILYAVTRPTIASRGTVFDLPRHDDNT